MKIDSRKTKMNFKFKIDKEKNKLELKFQFPRETRFLKKEYVLVGQQLKNLLMKILIVQKLIHLENVKIQISI